jgi:hypothetical protein
MYEDVVALSVLLRLDPTLHLCQDLGMSESLRLQHYERTLDISELYWEPRPVNRYFLSDIYPYSTLPPQFYPYTLEISMVLT